MSGVQKAHTPQRIGIGARGTVRIECIQAIRLRRYENNVVGSFIGNRQLRNIQGLRVHIAVDIAGKQLAELAHIDVGGSQNGLGNVLTRARVVVVIRQYARLGVGVDGHGPTQNDKPGKSHFKYRP